MSGLWRFWDDRWRVTEIETLSVMGLGLGKPKLWFPREPDETGSRGQGFRSKKKRVRFTFDPQTAGNRAAKGPTARVLSAPEKVKQLRAGPARDRMGHWAEPRPAEHRTEKLPLRGRDLRLMQAPSTSYVGITKLQQDVGSESKFAEDSSVTPPPYLSLMNNVFKSERLTKAAMWLKEKTVEIMRLNMLVKQAQIRQEPLRKETHQLLTEKLRVQAENKFFEEYLTKNTEARREQYEKLWEVYLQKCGEIQRRKQESASKYVKQTEELKSKFLQKEKIQFDLEQQLQAMKDISLVREKQERRIQTLQEEKKKAQAETDAKKQEVEIRFLQEKALLEKKLREPDVTHLGKEERKALHRKAQALQSAAEKSTFDFHLGIRRQSERLQKEILQQTWQCQELQATHSRLENQKQQLQQEQWYIESLIRGRQRLHSRHNSGPKGQGASKTTENPHLGIKSRIHPQ
ncbi:coiled-coil domain-containing protein 121 [Pteropus alecto]|uniref:Coiled-coil domain-containing protein 121 n=1 Tax=Pteropus alecto TaxID=9402 RepID=L5KS75_PTEAL|nr:coiled-coil domain-containing protein 121 [Pteropus alecto]ELK14080.1 Coiled-coil domain-containing protein 121 [Pteropus alecto]